MAIQDNSDRQTVLDDTKAALDALIGFKEVSFTVRAPEEVQVFPSAFIVGGTGHRMPADIQNAHFDQKMEVVVYMYWKEVAPGELAKELEKLIKKVVDKLDETGQELRVSGAYDLYVSLIETDEGKMAATGMKLAMAILTITALFPARDAP